MPATQPDRHSCRATHVVGRQATTISRSDSNQTLRSRCLSTPSAAHGTEVQPEQACTPASDPRPDAGMPKVHSSEQSRTERRRAVANIVAQGSSSRVSLPVRAARVDRAVRNTDVRNNVRPSSRYGTDTAVLYPYGPGQDKCPELPLLRSAARTKAGQREGEDVRRDTSASYICLTTKKKLTMYGNVGSTQQSGCRTWGVQVLYSAYESASDGRVTVRRL